MRADYESSASFLDVDDADSNEAIVRGALLRCRLSRIAGDFETMHAQASIAGAHSSNPRERHLIDAMLGFAARRLGDDDEAERLLSRVNVLIEEPLADLIEPAYLSALNAWRERDYDGADRIAQRFVKAGFGASLFLQLLGWSAVKRERYTAAGAFFVRALREFKLEAEPDLRNGAVILHGIAMIGCDAIDLKLSRLAIREYASVKWSESLWYEHFNVLLCLRYCRMLEGDAGGTWRDARTLPVIAAKPTYTIIAECVAASVSAQFGDTHACKIQLDRAWELIGSVSWSEAKAEERMGLAEFALLASSSRPAEARKALMLLGSLRAKSDSLSALDRDRRSDAYETWADARILEVSGKRSDALARYRRAYEIWNELGHVLRAAFVGMDLYRLTSDSVWLDARDRVLRAAPNALLPVATKALPRITPAQSRVLVQLLDGQSAKGGAKTIGCSASTFVNHTRKVFEAFDVRSRDELKGRCAELGISSQTLRNAGYR